MLDRNLLCIWKETKDSEGILTGNQIQGTETLAIAQLLILTGNQMQGTETQAIAQLLTGLLTIHSHKGHLVQEEI